VEQVRERESQADAEVPEAEDIFAGPARWSTTPVTIRADYKKKTGSSDTHHTYDTTAV
jgi:hypothetical protein